jgi:hypothetical protein
MKIEQWHRRHAITLAVQLPDGSDDSLAILECLREIVLTFLQVDTPAEPAKAPVVTLIRSRPDLSA